MTESLPITEPLVVDYYTDILCVWGWIAQRRIDELQQQFGDRVRLEYHYLDVFGDVPSKMANQWAARGGYDGFAEHVIRSADGFEDAHINPNIWTKVRPVTSANAHMILKAVRLCEGSQASADFALVLRKAFFIDACNIGELPELYRLLEDSGLDTSGVKEAVADGSALAALMGDYQQARQQSLKGSPSYIIDNGRQTLYGNVGYRVLHANIEEQLRCPEQEASWC